MPICVDYPRLFLLMEGALNGVLKDLPPALRALAPVGLSKAKKSLLQIPQSELVSLYIAIRNEADAIFGLTLNDTILEGDCTEENGEGAPSRADRNGQEHPCADVIPAEWSHSSP